MLSHAQQLTIVLGEILGLMFVNAFFFSYESGSSLGSWDNAYERNNGRIGLALLQMFIFGFVASAMCAVPNSMCECMFRTANGMFRARRKFEELVASGECALARQKVESFIDEAQLQWGKTAKEDYTADGKLILLELQLYHIHALLKIAEDEVHNNSESEDQQLEFLRNTVRPLVLQQAALPFR